jgi:hypothetical protein
MGRRIIAYGTPISESGVFLPLVGVQTGEGTAVGGTKPREFHMRSP